MAAKKKSRPHLSNEDVLHFLEEYRRLSGLTDSQAVEEVILLFFAPELVDEARKRWARPQVEEVRQAYGLPSLERIPKGNSKRHRSDEALANVA